MLVCKQHINAADQAGKPYISGGDEQLYVEVKCLCLHFKPLCSYKKGWSGGEQW